MPIAFLLGTLTLMGILWFKSRKAALGRHDFAQALRAFAAVFGSFATTGLAIGGRWGLAAVALLATLAFLRSLFNAWRGALPFGQKSKRTKTETAYLRMQLDHDSGEMDGQVKAGTFRGVVLSVMQVSQLITLRDEINAADFESLPLIDAYLDHRSSDWRGEFNFQDAETDIPMDEAQALEILGLSAGASAIEIKRAHRELISKVHPDRGGSGHLAAQVNAAKELLLQRR